MSSNLVRIPMCWMCWKWLTNSIVHSNVYGLDNIHCIRYLIAVGSLLSTSSALQSYHHVTSVSVKVPPVTTARNSSSIGEVPVPSGTPPTSIRILATIMVVSYAEQGMTTFTDVLQKHKTVVLVGFTFEFKLDATWMKSKITALESLMFTTDNTTFYTLSLLHRRTK